MRIKLLMVVLFAGSVCIENVQAQASGDLQQQINVLQQQIDALKRTNAGAQRGGQQQVGGVQGGSVQLRPIETGRSTTLKGNSRAGSQGAQGMQGGTTTQQQQLERRLEQLRAEQARTQNAAPSGRNTPGGGEQIGATQGTQSQGAQSSQGSQMWGTQGARQSGRAARRAQMGEATQSGYYTPQAQYSTPQAQYGAADAYPYSPYGNEWGMPGGQRQGRQRGQRTGGAGGYGGGFGGYSAVAIKTNLASGVLMAPGLGIEFGLSRKTSLDLAFQYNGWGRAPEKLLLDPGGSGKLIGTDGTVYKEKQIDHLLGKAELRLWLMERMHGQFLGIHALYSKYDVYGMNVPLLFEKDLRYDGTALGFGLSYGYKWEWSGRWGLEASIGLGMVSLDYDKGSWHPSNSQTVEAGRFKKTYFGPTGIGARLYFMLK